MNKLNSDNFKIYNFEKEIKNVVLNDENGAEGGWVTKVLADENDVRLTFKICCISGTYTALVMLYDRKLNEVIYHRGERLGIWEDNLPGCHGALYDENNVIHQNKFMYRINCGIIDAVNRFNSYKRDGE